MLYEYSIVFSQAISKLIEAIRKKLETEEKDISKVNYFLDNYDFNIYYT